jgi:hypothetical protein
MSILGPATYEMRTVWDNVVRNKEEKGKGSRKGYPIQGYVSRELETIG